MANEEEGGRRNDSYDVGYGKPPKHSQFKPGQSGNPRGRPKGSKSLQGHLRDQLNQRITISAKGQTRTIPTREAIAMRMTEATLKGDLKTIAQVLALDAQQSDAKDEQATVVLSPEEQRVLAEFLAPVFDAEAEQADPESTSNG